MTIEEIIQALKTDPRNESYSQRGIPPVLQINPEAKLLIIGQAPGSHVEKSLIPFDDKSGVTLMEWLGIGPESFYSQEVAIMPMDFYYPGKGKSGDLPPRKFIAHDYHQSILALMPKIQMTLLIGAYANKFYLGKAFKKNLTQTVASYQEYLPDYFPLVHPSPLNFRWQAKNPWFKKDVLPDLKIKVAQILGEN